MCAGRCELVLHRKANMNASVILFVLCVYFQPVQPLCAADQWNCTDNTCVKLSQPCDRKNDCGDGSDEQNCAQWRCQSNKWRCNNDICIHFDVRCNGKDDCGDNSDEINCDQWRCPQSTWKCNNSNHCVWFDFRCNDRRDCSDGSDEQNCEQWQCPAITWNCGNSRHCIWRDRRCNGERDCSDGSDEDNCQSWTCPAGTWRCSNNRCISTVLRCDGHNHCNDGSDELDCDQWTCPDDYWQCSNRQCTRSEGRCDGHRFGDLDCRDGSDEDNCEMTSESLSTSTWMTFSPSSASGESEGTSESLATSPEVTTFGATVTTNPSKVQNTATLTLKYVLLTVCTQEKENEVETTVHARIVQQNEEWPGLCRDNGCSNAYVTATCDGTFSKSITTIVEIEQVPDTLLSKVNQTAESTRSVLFNAAQGDAFDLQTIDAVLQKAEILIKLIKTCTRGYTYTGTECVKQEQPSSSSTVVLGASIGGVFGFLVVLIVVVLVVVIYRRLGWKHAGRQARQDDEHDYSALAIAGQSKGSGHSGYQGPMQLSPLGFELDNPSYGIQQERPVSDYDVIGMDNPHIASLLTEQYSPDEDPGCSPCNPYDEYDDYDEAGNRDGKVQNSSPEKAAQRKGDGSDIMTPSMPRESTETENPPDYLPMGPPLEMSDQVRNSDYLTPLPKLEKSDDPNYSDCLTPHPRLEITDDGNHSGYQNV